MAEETQVLPTQTAPDVNTFNPFAGDAWSETVPQPAAAAVEEKPNTEAPPSGQTSIPTPTLATQEQEEILDPKEWLKREFEVDDAAIIKQQLKEYQELKNNNVSRETQFANDQSKQLYQLIAEGKTKEVMKYLNEQDQLERYTSGEVTKDSADQIIKLNMQMKYPTLTQEQVEFQFNEDYGIPRKPVQKDTEDETEFSERLQGWEEQVRKIEMKKTIAATMAIPDLQKLKAQIQLPELTKPQPANQVNQPDPEALKKLQENFLRELDNNYAKVDGFETAVKNELVDFTAGFKIPDEAKVAIKNRLAENFDVNGYFENRWFPEGKPSIETLMKDVYVLENLDKILSGVSTNVLTKSWEAYDKQKSNVHINGNGYQQTYSANGGNQNINPFGADAWSEKPPSFNN